MLGVELGFEVEVDAVGLPLCRFAAWWSSSLTNEGVGVAMVSAGVTCDGLVVRGSYGCCP